MEPEGYYNAHKSPPLVLFSPRWIQSVPAHPIFQRSILISSSYLRLDLSSGVFRSGFANKILYKFSSLMRAICPVYVILPGLEFIIQF
jgi:hypothetical protein